MINPSGVPPVLSITKTHAGTFTLGEANAAYTITVSNQNGAGPTVGGVTVTDTLPSGLSFVSIAGAGWNCGGYSCTRIDALAGGASYPPITVTVNVAANASSPQVNQAMVTGGESASASASDSTTIINPNPPLLSITKTHTGSFSLGQVNAAYTVSVSNQSGAGPTVERLPSPTRYLRVYRCCRWPVRGGVALETVARAVMRSRRAQAIRRSRLRST